MAMVPKMLILAVLGLWAEGDRLADERLADLPGSTAEGDAAVQLHHPHQVGGVVLQRRQPFAEGA
jgi:hypothetical protein